MTLGSVGVVQNDDGSISLVAPGGSRLAPLTISPTSSGGTGLVWFLTTPSTASTWEIRDGTSASPETAPRATVRINRLETAVIATGFLNGQTNEQNAALVVMTQNTAGSQVQNTAIFASAKTVSTQTGSVDDGQGGTTTANDDAFAINAQGRASAGVGTGAGVNAVGWKDVTGAACLGIEAVSRNNSGTADTGYDPAAFPRSCAIWAHSTGAASMAGIVVANPFSSTVEVGFAVNSQNGGPIAAGGSSFRCDATGGGYGLRLNGTYSLAPIAIGDTCVLPGGGAPSGSTGANVAGKGSLYTDTTNGKLYINTGTKASPTWTVVGTQS